MVTVNVAHGGNVFSESIIHRHDTEKMVTLSGSLNNHVDKVGETVKDRQLTSRELVA